MTTLHDIACPACEEQQNLIKIAIDRYRCQECETEFTTSDVLP